MRAAFGPLRRHSNDRRPPRSTLAIAALLIWGLAIGGLGAVIPVAAQVGEPFVTADVVPADALAYTVVPLDPDSAQWKLALSLIYRAEIDPVVDQIQAVVQADEADESFAVDQLLGGEAALVVTDTAAQLFINETISAATQGAEGEDAGNFRGVTESGIAFVMTADSPDLIAAAVQSSIMGTADATGVEVQQTEHEGVTIDYVEVAADSGQTPLATARVDDFVLVAGFPVDLEPLIETSQGTREPLSGRDEYNEVRAALDEDHLAFGYLNPFPSDGLRSALGEAGLPVGYFEGESPASGFLVAADEAGFRLETVALGAAGSASASDVATADLLGQTPDDALIFLAGTDLASSGILDSVGALFLTLAGFVPPDTTAESLDEQLDAQFAALALNYGVNLRTEVLQQLTGAFGLWFTLDDENGALSSLFSSGVTEPSTVLGALSQLTFIVQSAGSGELTIVTRPVAGDNRVYVIETGDPVVPKVEFGVVEDRLVIGLGDGADNVDPGPDAPLGESERFQALMAALPAASSGLVYIDLEQAVPLLNAAAAEADVDEITDDIEGIAAAADEESPAGSTVTAGDAHPDCAAYPTQADAQTAYDAFEPGTFNLDQDFDGTACDDFFGGATPVAATPAARATPLPAASADQSEPAPADLPALTAFGLVAYDEDGNSRTSSLLLIGGADD